MMKRKSTKEQVHPYVSVDQVDDRFLDWALVNSTTKKMQVQAVMEDKKLYRQMKPKMDEEINPMLYQLELAHEMKTYFNCYNTLVNNVMEFLLVDAEELIPEMEQCDTPVQAAEIAIVYGLELCEVLSVLRLYKKGKYAEKYIPAIIAHENFMEQLDVPSRIVYEQLAEDDWYECVYHLFEESPEFNSEGDERILESAQVANDSSAYYKKQITEMLDRFESACNEADPEEIVKLTEKLAEQTRFIAELEKQGKSKDTQIKKLQKEQSRLQKNDQALQIKFDDAKKQYGLKSMEVGELRKEFEAIQKVEANLKRQVTSLQAEQDKLALRVELDLSIKYKNELAKVQDRLHNNINSLTAINENLTSELNKERDKAMELEESAVKLKTFQTELLNKRIVLEKEHETLRTENARFRADNTQAVVIAQLQAEKAKLQQELSNIRAAVAGSTVTSPLQLAQVPTQLPETITIADDLFDDLMLAVNKPIEVVQTEETGVGQVASIPLLQDGDEFDIFSLTENKPE